MEKSGNPRATLLMVNAQMFVAAPARDREAVETFEALALGFLPLLDTPTLVTIARILTPCPDTPDSVLAYLLRHSPQTRDVVIGHSRHAGAENAPALFGSSEGRMALAARAGIDALTVARLLVLEEAVVDDALAANKSFVSCEEGFALLLDRARHRPALAHILLSREDLCEHDEAALYLAASPERRDDIRLRLHDTIAHRRAVVSFSLSDDDRDTLTNAARKGDGPALEAFLTTAFGFPDGTQWHVLRTDRHDLLPLALKALGLSPREMAGIAIDLHPALAHPLSAIKRLIRVARETDSAVALALVEAILNVQALSARD
ncbi:hypothetical protein [Microvirga antarctica]|uniref:hypothetical protein n=1 Tax=Microvirga antarctica TaxID=2819233 RepID=UPI001B30BF64|nr:hypothetical protein [Microvirga antarctica]